MGVIRTPPCAKQSRLRECRKNLARQQLVAQSGVETFNDSVLPRRAWLDVQRVGSAFFAPLFHHIRNELASIVAANILWRATYRGQLVKQLACIANHVVDACVRVRASALQDAFDMCSQQVFFAAHFDVGQPRDMLVVARSRK